MMKTTILAMCAMAAAATEAVAPAPGAVEMPNKEAQHKQEYFGLWGWGRPWGPSWGNNCGGGYGWGCGNPCAFRGC